MVYFSWVAVMRSTFDILLTRIVLSLVLNVSLGAHHDKKGQKFLQNFLGRNTTNRAYFSLFFWASGVWRAPNLTQKTQWQFQRYPYWKLRQLGCIFLVTGLTLSAEAFCDQICAAPECIGWCLFLLFVNLFNSINLALVIPNLLKKIPCSYILSWVLQRFFPKKELFFHLYSHSPLLKACKLLNKRSPYIWTYIRCMEGMGHQPCFWEACSSVHPPSCWRNISLYPVWPSPDTAFCCSHPVISSQGVEPNTSLWFLRKLQRASWPSLLQTTQPECPQPLHTGHAILPC